MGVVPSTNLHGEIREDVSEIGCNLGRESSTTMWGQRWKGRGSMMLTIVAWENQSRGRCGLKKRSVYLCYMYWQMDSRSIHKFSTRWFKVTFWSPIWRSLLILLKGHIVTIPQNCQVGKVGGNCSQRVFPWKSAETPKKGERSETKTTTFFQGRLLFESQGVYHHCKMFFRFPTWWYSLRIGLAKLLCIFWWIFLPCSTQWMDFDVQVQHPPLPPSIKDLEW